MQRHKKKKNSMSNLRLSDKLFRRLKEGPGSKLKEKIAQKRNRFIVRNFDNR